MRKNIRITIIPVLLLCLFSESYGQFYSYNQPFEREYGKQKVRAEFISYRTVKEAWSKTRDSLENASILNGVWKTTITSDTASAVRTSNISGWNNVTVPTIKADKKNPLYTPDRLPVMEEKLDMEPSNSFTVLRTDFIIPFDYLDKAIFMHIGGVTNKTSIYINGKKVAVLRESMIPQEVKISSAIVRGRNTLTLVMDSYNEESILERWDTQFSPSVIGDVYVFAQPKIRMFDFMHKTTLDPTYKNGLLEAALILKTELINTHRVTVYYDLYDANGRIVNSDYKDVDIGWYRFDTIRFMSSIKNVNLWSAKNPYLYTIVYRVKREGRTYENVIRKVGFRQVEVKDGDLLINGEKEPIYGINADLYTELVASISSYDQKRDVLKRLKANGFNAIRTPYPLCEDFYDLASKMGFYVSETAPICSHGLSSSMNKGGTLANNPAWSPSYVSRVVDTYEKGKDHTSIIMWEMGEDAGCGCSMYDAYVAIKNLEGYRPIAYSDGGYQWISDLCVSPCTPKVEGADKPYIPNRIAYEADFWENNQGCFLSETIDGRVGNSTYSENIGLIDNFKEPEKIQESPNLWDKIKGKDKKAKKEKKGGLFGKKASKSAQVIVEEEEAVASAATAAAVTTATATEAAVSTQTASSAQKKINEEAEQVISRPIMPEKEPVSNGPVKAKCIDKNTYEIFNGLDKNLNNYKVIHATMDESGKINPVELLTINVEPGQSTTITLTKTGKNKKSFLLIGGVARIEL